MIATALQFITFTRSLSAKTWLVAITLVTMLTAAAKLVTYGEHREALRVATAARTDTINTGLASLHVAQTEERTALAQLAVARAATVTAAIARTNARKTVILQPVILRPVIPSAARNLHPAAVDSLPTAIITLITADNAKITADSIYIAAADSLIASIAPLERAHATLDTTLIHPLETSTRQVSWFPGGRYAIAGILGIGARLCYNLVRRRPLAP